MLSHPDGLPAGTVTFLFTDIEGSVRLWEADPESMRAALARHDEILHDAVAARGGFVFKTMGDAFCAAFTDAAQALAAAAAAQLAILGETFAGGTPVRVRMALYTGEAEAAGGDYFGPPVNRCARLLGVAHGEQIVLASGTAEAMEGRLPAGITLRSLGTHQLRDLPHPEEVLQLLHPGLPADFPPLRALAALTHNLPYQATSFVGRERDLAHAESLLSETRLLTITGIGGVGKTRLAVELGFDLLPAWPDGVWFVGLGTVSEPTLVAPTAVAALGLKEQRQESLLDTLCNALRGKRLLLLLDNCEHLVDAVAEVVSALLRRCPDVRVVATGREALRAEGELAWQVPVLAVPDDVGLPAHLADYEAVQLFVDRARGADPAFALDERNAAAVGEICRRLDGIPLAIELAATRTAVLTPQQLVRRLDDRFGVLTSGRRGAEARQQTLRATIDWSYDLLSPAEQVLLGRVSVFAGGFELEAVGAAPGVLDDLAGLVQKSLVFTRPRADELRYDLPETVRSYAAEKLQESGEADAARYRHAVWFTALVAQGADLLGNRQAGWFDDLEREHANLRAAADRLLASDPPAGAELVLRLRRYWEVRGVWSEGREWYARVLAADVALPVERRADLLLAAGTLARFQGDLGEARSMAEEARTTSLAGAYLRGVGGGLNDLGTVALIHGDLSGARALYQASLAARERDRDERGAAVALHNLGMVAYHEADYAAAQALYERSLAMTRSSGDWFMVAQTLNNLGIVYHARARYEEARVRHQESLELRRELGDRSGVATSLHNLATVAQEQGDNAAARALYEQAMQVHEETGNRAYLANTLNNLGNMAYDEREVAVALAHFERAQAL
ncbi:MAG: tetratricopeptide repeat protein, partial [Armatimonadetes bacterium]|nr:tetratricopeptide repeat protein [Armatimonadota bacterium]